MWGEDDWEVGREDRAAIGKPGEAYVLQRGEREGVGGRERVRESDWGGGSVCTPAEPVLLSYLRFLHVRAFMSHDGKHVQYHNLSCFQQVFS